MKKPQTWSSSSWQCPAGPLGSLAASSRTGVVLCPGRDQWPVGGRGQGQARFLLEPTQRAGLCVGSQGPLSSSWEWVEARSLLSSSKNEAGTAEMWGSGRRAGPLHQEQEIPVGKADWRVGGCPVPWGGCRPWGCSGARVSLRMQLGGPGRGAVPGRGWGQGRREGQWGAAQPPAEVG